MKRYYVTKFDKKMNIKMYLSVWKEGKKWLTLFSNLGKGTPMTFKKALKFSKWSKNTEIEPII